jgi:glycosyltransferase involved in cell wall biosynthesis
MYSTYYVYDLFEFILMVEKNKIRIIHLLLGKANPNSMNGVNKIVHHLASQQCRAGHEVEVWGITHTPKKTRHQHEYPLKLFRSVRARFSLSKALRAALHTLKPKDIVHMHSVFLPELYIASRIARSNGVPWVITPHGGYALESMKKNWFAKRVYIALFETRILRQANVVHVNSASEVDDIRAICRPKKVVIIPNGQDLQEIEYIPKPLSVVERPIFGFCGRLVARHKGLDLLIDGFAVYNKQGGKGRLWFIGDGEDRVKLSTQAQNLGIAEKVEFLGPMFGNKKLNHVSHMDVFCHPSRWEGMPMAVLEAAGLSRPLLVSQETNLGPYISKHGAGFVLFKNRPHTIAQAMQRFENIISSGRLSEIGLNARKMVETDFGWPHIASKLVEIYLR